MGGFDLIPYLIFLAWKLLKRYYVNQIWNILILLLYSPFAFIIYSVAYLKDLGICSVYEVHALFSGIKKNLTFPLAKEEKVYISRHT